MALELAAIRDALADKIAAGVNRSVNVYAYPLTNPSYPAVSIAAGGQGAYVAYHGTFGDNPVCDVRYTVTVTTTGVDEISPQIVIDDLLSSGIGQSSSVIDAICTDRTLGGVVSNTYIASASQPQMVVDGDGRFIVSASLDVLILTVR